MSFCNQQLSLRTQNTRFAHGACKAPRDNLKIQVPTAITPTSLRGVKQRGNLMMRGRISNRLPRYARNDGVLLLRGRND